GLILKALIGITGGVAFALQADGWDLRSDIIWAKPNPMPESVRDRPTKSHEYLFLLSKSPRYYYDADAIAEEATHAGLVVKATVVDSKNASMGCDGLMRNVYFDHDNENGETRKARSAVTI